MSDKKKEHRLDIYSLEGYTKDTPVIIDIHGGGLFYGYKELNMNFNCELVKRGFKVISLSYTLLPWTTLRGQLAEIIEAFNFIRTNAKKYELNIDNLFLVGDSAGALLAYISTALNNSSELQDALQLKSANIDIKALGLIAIMLETQRNDSLRPISNLISNKKDEKYIGYKYLFKPKLIIDIADFPRTFFNTSKQDFLNNETLVLYELFTKNSKESVLHNWPKGTDHELGHVFPVSYPLYKESKQELDDMCKFFMDSL